MHRLCVRLGNLPYVAVLSAAMGLFAVLFPFGMAEAVSGEGADLLRVANPIQSTPESGISEQAISTEASGPLRVVDGDTLAIGAVKIRLYGIDAPELAQTCSDMQGGTWACGAWSKAVLARLAVGNVVCVPRDRDRYDRVVAVCSGSSGDLNAAMVSAGAAYAYEKYAMDYVALEAQARTGGHGIWRAGGQDPSAYRASKRPVFTPQTPPKGCAIKGNISKSGKLYHLPGGRWYSETRINAAEGERWFCSEHEARAAGWRPARG